MNRTEIEVDLADGGAGSVTRAVNEVDVFIDLLVVPEAATGDGFGVPCVSRIIVEGDSIDAEIVPCVSGAASGTLEQAA